VEGRLVIDDEFSVGGLLAAWRWNGTAQKPAPLRQGFALGGGRWGYDFILLPSRAGGIGLGIGEIEVRNGRQTLARGSFVGAGQADAILAQVVPARGRLSVWGVKVVGGGAGSGGSAARVGPLGRVRVEFAYSGAAPGTGLAVRWTREGSELPRCGTDLRARGEAGRGSAWLAASGQGLPVGTYRVEVREATSGETLAAASFEVVPQP
jgi:hypothetical protein